MTDMNLVVDCETGEETLAPLTADEAAAVVALQQQVADDAAAQQAKVVDRQQALDQLKTLAAQNQPVDAALLTRVLGVSQP